MSRNVDELKKIAARVTTASGDVSAVKGNTVSEVLNYIVNNFSVDTDKKLTISKIGANLLKNFSAESVVFPDWEAMMVKRTGNTIGLESSKQYELALQYLHRDGNTYAKTVPVRSQGSNLGSLIFTTDRIEGMDYTIRIHEYADGSSGSIVYDASKSCIELIQNGSDGENVMSVELIKLSEV